MRDCKFFLITALFITLVHVSFAQVQVHVGATTAYNATFVLDKGLSEDPRYNSTMTYNLAPVGFTFGVDFTNKFGLTLESIISNQGQIYEVINVAKQAVGERKIDLKYLHLPLLLKFMSAGNGGARANFNIGPQLSLLTGGVESLTTGAGDYEIPQGVDFETIKQDYPAATQSPAQAQQGIYTLPSDIPTTDLLTKKANDFKNAEFQIAAAFGLDIDLAKHLFLTLQVRANYSLTDMRNDDIIQLLKSGDVSEIFGQRANLIVGAQLGLHYMFGTTRSFKFKN